MSRFNPSNELKTCPLNDTVSYINDQSKQFNQCARHHSKYNRSAEAVAIRAAEILDRISADIKLANTQRQTSTSLPELREVRDALKAFASGVDILPWGKIKAYLPTDLAKSITSFNVKADNALTILNKLIERNEVGV